MTTIYKFKAAYTKLGIGTAPGSAPVVTVVDSSNNVLVNAQAATAISNLPGVYLYSCSGADGLDLIGKFHTDDPTVDQQDLYSYTPDILTTNLDEKISQVDIPLGAGAIATSITVTAAGIPVDGVDVWITTDLAGNNVIARGDTNDSGVVTFLLDAGDYFCWKQLAGYSFTNPESLAVSS